MSNRVCVIGAGSSGIASCQVLNARGIEFDCFETGSGVGGNWRYMNDNGMSSAYESLHINTSRRTMAYATFPMPEDYPDYPNHRQITELLRRLRRPLRVPRQDPVPDRGDECRAGGGGGWKVSWRELEGGEEGSDVYRAVMVANGHHWDARWPEPEFKGQSGFEGEQMHVHDYKTPDVLRGKRVLVLGIGNSATDIAVESSRNAEKTFLAMRRSAWVVPKYMNGRPTDELANPFVTALPFWVFRAIYKRNLKMAAGHPTDFGLAEPDHELGQAHPTISSDVLPRIGHGDITVKPNIAEFTGGRGVRFTDGSEEEIDVIVWCTGYKITFPFFDEEPDLGARQRDPALPARRLTRAPGPLLHRPPAAARRDHAACRGAVGVGRRPAPGEGRSCRRRPRCASTSAAIARRCESATSPRSGTRSRSTSIRICAGCGASAGRGRCGRSSGASDGPGGPSPLGQRRKRLMPAKMPSAIRWRKLRLSSLPASVEFCMLPVSMKTLGTSESRRPPRSERSSRPPEPM